MSLINWSDWDWGWPSLTNLFRDPWFREPSRDTNRGALTTWTPTSDLTETNNEIVLTVELPGVRKEDINIELRNGILSVSGERKVEKKSEDERFYRSERSYGFFRRSLRVPENLKEAAIKASFNNGVLEVRFPRAQALTGAEGKRIAITSS